MPQLVLKKGSEIFGEPFVFNENRNEIVTIGRHASNDLVLAGKNVSRYHAAIILSQENRFFIRDLGSQNSTKVNNKPVYRHILKQGDRIEIEEFILTYEEKEPESTKYLIPIIEEASTFEAKPLPKDLTAFSSESFTSLNISFLKLPTAKTEIFNDITKRFGVLSDQQSLLEDIVESICYATKAERGYVALIDREKKLYISVPLRINIQGGEPIPALSRALYNLIIDQKKPFCSDNFQGSGTSVICNPLMIGENVAGLIYLEKRDSTFQDDDLRFVTLLLEYAADPLEKSKQGNTQKTGITYSSPVFKWKCKMAGNRKTAALQEVYEKIRIAGKQEGNVLILGETGTGKEVVARRIHGDSSRRTGAFVPVELSALPSGDMVANELFGHVKGAFTGAVSDKKGKFEIAQNGTLFLDEIGDIGIKVQGMLRRAIENKEIAKIGEEKTIKVDTRIISATNINLKQAVKDKTFREDLFERLGLVINLPCLKNRKEDIPLLAHYFIDESGTGIKGLSPKAVRLLMVYDWPRNIRELENCIKQAIMKSEGREIIYPWDFSPEIQHTEDDMEPDTQKELKETLQEKECEEIRGALEQTEWNVTEAAKILGLKSRQTLYSKMRKYGIKKPK